MKLKAGTINFSLFLLSIFIFNNTFSRVSIKSDSFSLTQPFSCTKELSPVSDTSKKNDRDGDGITDSLDKCPDEKGVIQYDGCPIPDSDNDGITDDIDECPTVAGLARYKGCLPTDRDGDKINDEEDKCPDQPGVARYGGCPVGDKDGDGVNDDDDKCIDIPGTVNNGGCPEDKKILPIRKKLREKRRGVKFF